MNAIETKVLELIGEDPEAPDVFVDTDEGMAPIRESIADAVSEIVMLTGSHKRQYLIPLREDQQFYRLTLQNGDLGWITDAWSITQKYRLEQTDLVRLSAYDPRWMIGAGSSQSYFPVGKDIIGFYPKSSASVNVVELTVVEIPRAYASSADRVKLRESFEYAAVHFAVAEYWATRGDANEAQSHTQKYLAALGLEQEYMPQSGQPRSLQTRKEPWPQGTA
jgi:hypothetical protein